MYSDLEILRTIKALPCEVRGDVMDMLANYTARAKLTAISRGNVVFAEFGRGVKCCQGKVAPDR